MATEKTVGAYLEITLKVNENDRAAAQLCTQSIVNRFWIQYPVQSVSNYL